MDDKHVKQLRGTYHALLGFQKLAESTRDKSNVVRREVVDLIQDELNRLNTAVPGLIPPTNLDRHRCSNQEVYYSTGISAVLSLVLSRIKVELETADAAPVTKTKEFSFVQDEQIREILERDYIELQKTLITGCHKSAVILAGSLIEAILVDLLLANADSARASAKAPKSSDITRWDLAPLIDVAIDTRLVERGVDLLSHSVREYRNLVHPGNEIRNKLTFGQEEAQIAFNVINILHRDLSL